MEMFNFSTAETKLFEKALTFVNRKEADVNAFLANTLIVKTENFFDECDQLAPYYGCLGLEDTNARLVFNPAKGGNHKILLNKTTIIGLSYIHTLVAELVHLANFVSYNAEFGNVYRFTQDQGIANYYYEFLLWTKFQAMKIGIRAHALVSWHEVNGENPPEKGCYQFAEVKFHSDRVAACLGQLQGAEGIVVWREGFWNLLEELVFYFGRLAFYQVTPWPKELDESFPAEAIAQMIGLENSLTFYAVLQHATDYSQWQEQKQNIRRAIVAMQEHGKGLFATGA